MRSCYNCFLESRVDIRIYEAICLEIKCPDHLCHAQEQAVFCHSRARADAPACSKAVGNLPRHLIFIHIGSFGAKFVLKETYRDERLRIIELIRIMMNALCIDKYHGTSRDRIGLINVILSRGMRKCTGKCWVPSERLLYVRLAPCCFHELRSETSPRT